MRREVPDHLLAKWATGAELGTAVRGLSAMMDAEDVLLEGLLCRVDLGTRGTGKERSGRGAGVWAVAVTAGAVVLGRRGRGRAGAMLLLQLFILLLLLLLLLSTMGKGERDNIKIF